MADFRVYDELVTDFLLSTCRVHQWLNIDAVAAVTADCATVHASSEDEANRIPVRTGSAAEFHIQPPLSCVGDRDVMWHFSTELAIPAGTSPPTQLPDEFHSRVKVYEIVDSEFPGYVYLVWSYLLTECICCSAYTMLCSVNVNI